jgi:BirA family biotin operon repressor/biotin-[acetyl-CoA-carboxylase] ligase
MSGELDRTGWVVMGLGLNVHNEIPRSLPMATALGHVLKPRVNRLTLLNEFLLAFRTAYRQFEREGFEPFRKRYWENYRSSSEAVTVATARGTLKGIARGVDGEGRLVVESRRQTIHLFEGEIVS